MSPLPSLIAPFGPFTGAECSNCRVTSISVELQPISTSGLIEVILRNPEGEVIGTLYFPESYGSSGFVLDVDFATQIPNIPGDPRSPPQLGNAVLDITLFDSNGRPVTLLPEPITICIVEPSSSNKKVSFSGSPPKLVTNPIAEEWLP